MTPAQLDVMQRKYLGSDTMQQQAAPTSQRGNIADLAAIRSMRR